MTSPFATKGLRRGVRLDIATGGRCDLIHGSDVGALVTEMATRDSPGEGSRQEHTTSRPRCVRSKLVKWTSVTTAAHTL